MTTTNAQAALIAAAASYAATGRFTTTNEITTRAEDLQAWLDQTDRNNKPIGMVIKYDQPQCNHLGACRRSYGHDGLHSYGHRDAS